ncbi:MAG: ATP-binding cassette domain-containing protein [Bacilli bacterium]|nr:ATP-binding cassette domain-containing protein [Bacilli bacterium]
MLNEVSKMYDQIIDNDEKIKTILEKGHVNGIWEEKVKDLEEQIKMVIYEKNKYQRYLNKGGYTPEATKALEDGVSQREKQLEKLNKDLEYYKNNNVPLFVSRKLSRYEMDIEINRAAKILDLERYLSRKPAALSGGQRQRVALGRAIVRNPKVFLMDEPLSNLDAKLRVQTRSEIINIHKKVNATTIYVTHDQTEAMTMADRIVVMKDGYIQQIDAPYDIYYNPNNIFVASFIGNPPMNFLNCKFDGKNVCLDSDDGNVQVAFKLTDEQIKTLKDYKDKEIVIGIRPENMFQKGSQEIKDAKNFLDISCEFRELMGYDSIVHTHISGQALLVKVSSAKDIKSGDDLEVGFNNDALYFFNKEDGKRIR